MWGLLPRSAQITIVVGLVAYAGWVVSEASQILTGTAISPLKSTSLVGTIIGLAIIAFGVFWRKVWYWIPVLSRWFPDLTGRWEGTYVSSYVHPDGQKATGAFTAIIRQGLFTSSVTAKTCEMTSHSTRSWLEADHNAQRFTIGYTYHSIPNAAVRDRSPPHEGACFLHNLPDNDPDTLKGIYYTERRSIGDIDLKRVSRDTASKPG
jgi:hypothetical protein